MEDSRSPLYSFICIASSSVAFSEFRQAAQPQRIKAVITIIAGAVILFL
jgi:hypothetical protein